MAVSLHSTRELGTGGWRTFRPSYVTRPSPCNLDCPAGTDVRAFLTHAADNDAIEAWRTILAHNPLPAVCGRVCYHPCERRCNRLSLDEPVAVHVIERAIADAARQANAELPAVTATRTEAVAVVGAGPAGLSCAYHLARRGYPVTLFDAMREAGGMLRYGIPAYRLPRAILDHETGLLRQLGVLFVGGTRLGVNLPLDALDHYRATFVAIGAHRSRAAAVAGEDLTGVRSGVEFLRDVNSGRHANMSGRAVVIGGGNTALDTARVTLRLGAHPVIVYRRSREDMPAHPDEVAQAEGEGVEFIFNATPVRFVGVNGQLAGVEFQRMRPGAPERDGRRRPEPIPGATFSMDATAAFTAIGEEVEAEALAGLVDLQHGRLEADRLGRTRRAAILAGGDAATGAGTVVDAIGSGRRAAEAVDAHLRGGALAAEAGVVAVGPEDLNLFYFQPSERIRPVVLHSSYAVRSFEEVVRGLTWDEAIGEARRCMSCGACTECDNCLVFCPDAAIHRNTIGAYDIDLSHCKGCGVCVTECPRAALALVPEEAR